MQITSARKKKTSSRPIDSETLPNLDEKSPRTLFEANSLLKRIDWMHGQSLRASVSVTLHISAWSCNFNSTKVQSAQFSKNRLSTLMCGKSGGTGRLSARARTRVQLYYKIGSLVKRSYVPFGNRTSLWPIDRRRLIFADDSALMGAGGLRTTMDHKFMQGSEKNACWTCIL